jgi:hypothetical protein
VIQIHFGLQITVMVSVHKGHNAEFPSARVRKFSFVSLRSDIVYSLLSMKHRLQFLKIGNS